MSTFEGLPRIDQQRIQDEFIAHWSSDPDIVALRPDLLFSTRYERFCSPNINQQSRIYQTSLGESFTVRSILTVSLSDETYKHIKLFGEGGIVKGVGRYPEINIVFNEAGESFFQYTSKNRRLEVSNKFGVQTITWGDHTKGMSDMGLLESILLSEADLNNTIQENGFKQSPDGSVRAAVQVLEKQVQESDSQGKQKIVLIDDKDTQQRLTLTLPLDWEAIQRQLISPSLLRDFLHADPMWDTNWRDPLQVLQAFGITLG